MNLRTIRAKLLFAFGVIVFLSALMTAFGYYSIHKILNYNALLNEADSINNKVQSLALSEKEFLLHESINSVFYTKLESDNLSQAKEIVAKIRKKLLYLRKHSDIVSPKLNRLTTRLQQEITDFLSIYQLLVKKYLEKGIKDSGLMGELRSKIHEVENANFDYDKSLMLMLRRHEKDFFLRKEPEYLHKFDEGIGKFIKHLNQLNGNYFQKDISNLMEKVKLYRLGFHKVAAIEKEIGFQENTGIKGKGKAKLDEIKTSLHLLNQYIKVKSQRVYRQVIFTFLAAFLVQLSIVVLFGYRFIKRISKRIYQLQATIKELADGKLGKIHHNKEKDELNEAFLELNKLNRRIETAVDFAERIGNGQFSLHYDKQFSTGILETSLIKMQAELHLLETEKSRRNWTSIGLARFMDILRNTQDDILFLSRQIIAQLVKYTESCQGAIFILNEQNETPFLELKACYAYNKERLLEKKIEEGEGLLGQSFRKKKTILLNQFPENYLMIQSGLGEAKPKNLLLVPLFVNEKAIGVIELASLNDYEEYRINLVEKLAENISYTLYSVNMHEKNRKLLEDSQDMAHHMKAQEEEMHKYFEQLMKEQEESQKNEQKYLHKILLLEEALQKLNGFKE